MIDRSTIADATTANPMRNASAGFRAPGRVFVLAGGVFAAAALAARMDALLTMAPACLGIGVVFLARARQDARP